MCLGRGGCEGRWSSFVMILQCRDAAVEAVGVPCAADCSRPKADTHRGSKWELRAYCFRCSSKRLLWLQSSFLSDDLDGPRHGRSLLS